MNYTTETLKLFWRYACSYPMLFFPTMAIFAIATVIYRIIPPLIAADVIARLSSEDYIVGEFWQSFQNEILLFGALTFFGGVILYRIDVYMLGKLETYVSRNILRDVFNHYLKLDMSFHANNFGGSLVSRANKLVGSYIRLADTLFFQIIPFVSSFLAVMFIMSSKSMPFVIGFTVFTALFMIVTYLYSLKVRDLSQAEASAENKNTGSLADAITNVSAIKSFSAYEQEKQSFEKTTERTRQISMKLLRTMTTRDFTVSSVSATIQILALVVAVMAVVNRNADLAIVFLMFNYTAYLTDHLWQFNSATLKNFNRSMGDAYDGVATLNTKPLISDPPKPEKLRTKKGLIEFKNVTFDHNIGSRSTEKSLFHNLSLTIKPGEKVGLVGRSGGGKTTITKLLLRFSDINGGTIAIDGQDITAITQDDLRSVIAYVPQEPLLFHRSLAENIGYGNKDATPDEIVRAAKLAHAHEFIRTLKDGYDTLVGERGVKLSGGQRQRVAIARAMIKQAPILVLDEATSALDSESEQLIQDALWKLMENKTAIVIAHRLSTIQKMDRIIVLENGNIVEEGTHTQLLKENGTYAKLWAHQSGGFIEE